MLRDEHRPRTGRDRKKEQLKTETRNEDNHSSRTEHFNLQREHPEEFSLQREPSRAVPGLDRKAKPRRSERIGQLAQQAASNDNETKAAAVASEATAHMEYSADIQPHLSSSLLHETPAQIAPWFEFSAKKKDATAHRHDDAFRFQAPEISLEEADNFPIHSGFDEGSTALHQQLRRQDAVRKLYPERNEVHVLVTRDMSGHSERLRIDRLPQDSLAVSHHRQSAAKKRRYIAARSEKRETLLSDGVSSGMERKVDEYHGLPELRQQQIRRAEESITESREARPPQEHSSVSLREASARLRFGNPALKSEENKRKSRHRGARSLPPTAARRDAAISAATHETTQTTILSFKESSTPEPSKLKPAMSAVDTGNTTLLSPRKKLRFAPEEAAPPHKQKIEKRLSKAQAKAVQAETHLEAAESALPTKRVARIGKASGTESVFLGRMRFEKETISRQKYLQSSLITRSFRSGIDAIGSYSSAGTAQVEEDDIGVQATQHGSRLLESGLRGIYRQRRGAPYRRVERLRKKAFRLRVEDEYQQAILDTPKLMSNIFSRMVQRRKIKQRYAAELRRGETLGRVGQIGTMAQKAAAAQRFSAKAVTAVKNHPGLLGLLGSFLLMALLVSSLFLPILGILSNIGPAVFIGSYLAEDVDINQAELLYTELETDLRLRINQVEQDNPDFNEYRYNLGNIGHDPFALMAYLTAVYHDFQYADVNAFLRQVFDEQYTLTFTPTVETRYRLNADGVWVPYNWYVLSVSLTSRSFAEVIEARMDEAQRQHYDLLLQTRGNRQYFDSPFDFDWSDLISDGFGYRVHPFSGMKDYHKGIDIAVPAGTEIRAGHDGTVTFAGELGDYGLVVVIDNGKGLVTKYAHCDELLVSVGQSVVSGEIIAKSGNTGLSTGPHLHLEVIKSGQYLNPLYYAKTETRE